MITVTKQSGDRSKLDLDKLRRSLLKSGANEEEVEDVVVKMEPRLYEGIPTSKIYALAHKLLLKKKRGHAARYSLKRAILDLGPTGYPFEILILELFKRKGAKVQHSVQVSGVCVEHEVDVLADFGFKKTFVECKFHSEAKRTCDVKVPLYIDARFSDIQNKLIENGDLSEVKGSIYTNTRFTDDATKYAKCAGLELVSWDFPHDKSLKNQIDVTSLYPLTCLTSLTKAEKAYIISKGVVLASSLIKNTNVLEDAGVSPVRATRVLEEIKELCLIKGNG